MKKFSELDEAYFKVEVEGLPDMFIEADSEAGVKQELRKKLKKADDIKSVKRTTPTAVKNYFRDILKGDQDAGTEVNEDIEFTGFEQHITEQALYEEFLQEKLIMLSNGANYGQIVFLAGGAGSGKGFASDNFMEKSKFKVRDVDEWKRMFLKINKLTDKYPEIKGLDLRKPADVGKLHDFVDKKNIKDKSMQQLLSGMKNKETLPNIMFDITAKDVKSIYKMMPDLLRAGYNPANIHLVWVLTDYKVAIKANSERDRVVPDDIMFQTHNGAANTMYNMVKGIGMKLAINGAIHVILNNRENTIFFDKEGTNGQKTIKDFKYLTLKERGKSMKKEGDVAKQLYHWIADNIPATELKAMLKDQGFGKKDKK